MLNFTGRRRLPIIIQSEASECGLACLAMIASFYGHRTDLNTLRRQHLISLNGTTLQALIEIARHLNLTSRAVRLEPEELAQLKMPAILHWDMNHFVVSNAQGGKASCCTTRPAARSDWPGTRWLTISRRRSRLSPAMGFERRDERSRQAYPLSSGRRAEQGTRCFSYLPCPWRWRFW